MSAKREWAPYVVGSPSTRPNRVNDDCSPFESVFHVCHVKDAYRIFEDGKIRSSLVWDESRLKNTRTCVSWVSPNTWAAGSIYGNICFEFDWRELVQGKRFFWVEAITYYNPPAYRVLVSTNLPKTRLQEFDPTRRSLPLFYDSGRDIWYRNGKFTGEFLVDGDLGLASCKRVSFVKHNESICKRKACEYVGQDGAVAGARLLAMLLGNRLANGRDLFLAAEGKMKTLDNDAVNGFEYLLRKVFRHPGQRGFVKASDATAPYLATAIFARAGRGGKNGLKRLCGLFTNEQELRIAVVNRIRQHFRLRSVLALEELL
jgi:hypothetical protein